VVEVGKDITLNLRRGSEKTISGEFQSVSAITLHCGTGFSPWFTIVSGLLRGNVIRSCARSVHPGGFGLERAEETARIPTGYLARISLYLPELDRLYVALPKNDKNEAEIRVYQPQ
jgi:hypothetical protein